MDKIIGFYKKFSDKRYTTIAGTLVYFFIMSIAPFLLWLTLVFGNTSLHVERFISHELFEGVRPFLVALKSSAQSAASGAGLFFLLTTLYSSTNFFYHLRRSGEIVYGSKKVKGGIRLRIISGLLIIAVFLLIAVLALLLVLGEFLLDRLFFGVLSNIFYCVFLTAVAFTVTLLLNIFACPFKVKLSEVVPGSLLTCALWLIFLIGFAVYIQFASPEKLYGKITSIFVFLLWCYVMMSSFVVGIIHNASFKHAKEYKSLL